MEPSSRTPEGRPQRCPVCHNEVRIEPSVPPGDAPCPHCGHLLWFETPPSDTDPRRVEWQLERLARSLAITVPPVASGHAVGPRADVPPQPRGSRQQVHLVATVKGVVAVAAIIGFLLGLVSMTSLVFLVDVPMPAVAYVCGVLGSVGLSVGAALWLCLRDAVRGRVRAGLPVNFLLRLYFAWGPISLLAWIATAIGAIFLLVSSLLQ